jgi:signal transduction histidine kinase
MGVNAVKSMCFYPLPSPPPAWGRGRTPPSVFVLYRQSDNLCKILALISGDGYQADNPALGAFHCHEIKLSINKHINSFAHNLIEWVVERLPAIIHRERSGAFNYLAAIVLMGIALLVRMMIAPVNFGLQYITLFPAVTLAAVIGGIWPGLFATVIGISLATFIFTPPYYSFSIEAIQASTWSNMVFLTDAIIVCSSIEAMHRYRARYAEELRIAKINEARMIAINKELDDFAYIAAHDLKEPLRGIHNYASFLKEDYAGQLDEGAQQYVNNIQRLAERLSSLIDRLLAYSRLGSTELAHTPVDMDAVVDAVTKDLSSFWMPPALGGGGIELRRNGHLGTVSGDTMRINEVFQNLISNAAKYNDKPTKWVEVGCDRSGAQPIFYVRDNGIGIASQHHENVFRIFKRLHEQNKYGGGTGAGLTIVKKIIERQGGRIWLESVPGEGTVFYFTLNGET